MATQLDPVTGLPIVDSGFIDQIPLGVQVMPWDDLSATARPSRQPAYPDDILNTMAGVVGWRQDKPAVPQNVYTDGNHRLLVSTGSGGAVNAGNPWVATESGGDAGMENSLLGPVFGGSIGFSTHDPIRHLTLEVYPAFNGTSPGAWCEWEVGLSNNGANPTTPLFKGNFYKTEWTNPSVSPGRFALQGAIIDWLSWGLIPNVACFYLATSDGQCICAVNYILGH